MVKSSVSRAYAKAGLPLWVTPCEAHHLLRIRNFAVNVADELADWIARRLSMNFAAGFLGLKAVPVRETDVVRQLLKMGYCQANAQEIGGLICELQPGLYHKGCQRRSMVDFPA